MFAVFFIVVQIIHFLPSFLVCGVSFSLTGCSLANPKFSLALNMSHTLIYHTVPSLIITVHLFAVKRLNESV